jgi:hypothetical protein
VKLDRQLAVRETGLIAVVSDPHAGANGGPGQPRIAGMPWMIVPSVYFTDLVIGVAGSLA